MEEAVERAHIALHHLRITIGWLIAKVHPEHAADRLRAKRDAIRPCGSA